jgi:hypothetical protein
MKIHHGWAKRRRKAHKMIKSKSKAKEEKKEAHATYQNWANAPRRHGLDPKQKPPQENGLKLSRGAHGAGVPLLLLPRPNLFQAVCVDMPMLVYWCTVWFTAPRRGFQVGLGCNEGNQGNMLWIIPPHPPINRWPPHDTH